MWAKISAWLKDHLTNTWMNNQDFGFFMAHSGWAGIILLAAALFGMPVTGLGWLTIGGVVGAALKEFAYDANFELPKQSFMDNLTDFLGYCAGMTIAWAVIGIALATHTFTTR